MRITLKSKRTISIIFSIVIALSISPNAFAVTPHETNIQIHQPIYDKIEAAILSILPEKEHYGLNDLNISELSLGQYIPSFEIVNNKLVPLDLYFYPIFDGENKVVSMAAITTVNGDAIVSISTAFVEQLQSIMPDCKVSIVYDSDGPYLLTQHTMIKLADYPMNMDFGRSNITAVNSSELQQANGVSLLGTKPLTLDLQIRPLGEDDDSIYLAVPKVLQPTGSSICWAACVASTVNYKYYGPGSAVYTAQDIADMYGYNTALGCAQVINTMNALFSNMQYTNNGGNNNNFPNIWSYISSKDSPVIGRFEYSTGGGHFMVIRGMNYYGTFSVMDPLEAGATYRSGTITGTGNTRNFSIISYTGGSTLTLTHYGYKY